MNPDVVLILGCLGLAMTVTYVLHSLFRPLFLVQRLIEIRIRLRDDLRAKGRWEDRGDQLAYRAFSHAVDELIQVAPLFSPLAYGILRRVERGAGADRSIGPGAKESDNDAPLTTIVKILALDPIPIQGISNAILEAWTKLFITLFLHFCDGPVALLMVLIYTVQARSAPDPQRWLIGPLRAVLAHRTSGALKGMTLHR